MTKAPKHSKLNIQKHNTRAWDKQAELQHSWSKPVTSEVIESAKKGQWQIHITKRPIPADWLPNHIQNKDILCLASAGGQQAPVLAAAGANVTVFDISKKQLELDRLVANRDHLSLQTVQGDMACMDALKDESFDYIIHPISNLYVPNLQPVWQESYRVLRPGGSLLASFYNPVLFVFSKNHELDGKGLLMPKHELPYADIHALEIDQLEAKMKQHEPLIYGHTLSSQISGQIEAGFVLAGFYEDEHPTPRFLIEKYMKALIATRAIKR